MRPSALSATYFFEPPFDPLVATWDHHPLLHFQVVPSEASLTVPPLPTTLPVDTHVQDLGVSLMAGFGATANAAVANPSRDPTAKIPAAIFVVLYAMLCLLVVVRIPVARCKYVGCTQYKRDS
jgi:hypothetical protein